MAVARPSVVMISPVLPFDAVPHAGGVYLASLDRALSARADVTYLVSNVPLNRDARDEPGAPRNTQLLGVRAKRPTPGWALTALSHRLWSVAEPRWLRPLPHFPTVVDAVLSGPSRRALRHADVIDLQWEDLAVIAPMLRLINPRARLVGTFHDVLSQRHERLALASSGETRSWHWACARKARRAEASALARLDAVLTFSEKDARLLDPMGTSSKVHVVLPPVKGPEQLALPKSETRESLAVFVAQLSRDENRDAANWLVRSIWPLVLALVPDAKLEIVGSGAQADLIGVVAGDPSISLTGFVDDLSDYYGRARAAVVPMRYGAGVKFKTIEAMLHGVPTVTTTTGAEGIAGPERFVRLSDDPVELARGLASALAGPDQLATFAEETRRWAQQRYSREAFEAAISAAYFPPGSS